MDVAVGLLVNHEGDVVVLEAHVPALTGSETTEDSEAVVPRQSSLHLKGEVEARLTKGAGGTDCLGPDRDLFPLVSRAVLREEAEGSDLAAGSADPRVALVHS